MWIRSQNKETLIKAHVFEILSFGTTTYNIYSIASDSIESVKLGRYSSKKKALKVLDKLEDAIISPNQYKVFTMPQDNEVK